MKHIARLAVIETTLDPNPTTDSKRVTEPALARLVLVQRSAPPASLASASRRLTGRATP